MATMHLTANSRPGESRQGQSNGLLVRLIVVGLGTLFLLVAYGPLLALMVMTLQRLLGGESAWWRLLLPEARRMSLLLRSLAYAVSVSGTVTILGLLIASLLWGLRARPWARGRWLVLVFAPIPPYIHALAWRIAFRQLALRAFDASLTGSWWVQSMALLPLAVALALVGLETASREAIAAACVQRRPARVLARVVLPLALPVITVGAVLLFILTLLDYTVPSLYGVSVYPLEVFVEFSATNEPVRAFLYALPLLALAGASVLLCRPGLRQVLQRSAAPVRPDAILARLPVWLRMLQGGAVAVMALQITVPLAVLLTSVRPWQTALYVTAAARGEIGHSVAIAAAAAGLALLPAYGAARWLAGAKPARDLCWLAVVLPLAIPPPLIGIGLIAILNRDLPVDLYSTIWMPILASLARFAPLATMIIAARLVRLDRALLEAARILERRRLVAFWRVDLPLIAPAVFAAAATVFVLSLGEVGATLLVVPAGQTTLAIKVYNYLHYGASEAVAALSLVGVLLCLIVGLPAAALLARREGAR